MFTPIILARKGAWHKRAFSVVFAFCVAAAIVVFVGCKDEPDEKDNLIGTWTDATGGDGYTISAKTLTYNGYADQEHNPPYYDTNFEGKIVNDPNLEGKNGVIIIEYTKKPIDGVWENNVCTGPAAPLEGNFIAIYWKNLTAGSVDMAGAIATDYSNPATVTLQEAKTKFTIETANIYAIMYGAYSR
jgi:hypothetical protein